MGRILILILLFLEFLSGQNYKLLQSRARFPNASSAALAGSNVVRFSGVASFEQNPAILGEVSRKNLEITNMEELISRRYSGFGLVIPLNTVHIAFNYLNLNHQEGDLAIENEQSQAALGLAFRMKFVTLGLGYGYQWSDQWQAYDWRKSMEASFTSAGIIWNKFQRFKIGLAVKKSAGSKKIRDSGLTSGLEWIPYLSRNMRFSVYGGYWESRFHLGVEESYRFGTDNKGELLFRLGKGNLNLKSNEFNLRDYFQNNLGIFNIGLGIHLPLKGQVQFGIDYCLQLQNYFTNQHIVSLGFVY